MKGVVLSSCIFWILLFAAAADSGFDAVARFTEVQRQAAGGDPDANYELAWQYEHGLGTTVDKTLALQHYRIAAEGGSAGAAFGLGSLLSQRPSSDAAAHAEAVTWFQRGADLNHTGAMNALAAALAAGRGVAQNLSAAVRWYRSAAERGDALGAYNLGYAYHTGVPAAGLAQDDHEALKWYRSAAERGHPAGLYAVGASLSDGLGAPQNDTAAAGFFQRAAARGSVDAMTVLGLWYSIGRGVGRADVAAGTRWYVQAARAGSSKAQFIAGYRLLRGEGAEKDPQQGLRWLRDAAHKGHAAAASFLDAYKAAGMGGGGGGGERIADTSYAAASEHDEL